MFKGKHILITGTGSWATEIIKQLQKLDVKSITAFSRNELAVVLKKRQFQDDSRVSIEVGDITNIEDCQKFISKADIVICTSALKHVSIAEDNPLEAIRVNIEGTKNILKVCSNNSVEKCILVSTDKAVNPINTYGLTKALAEKLFLDYADKVSDTQFIIFRAGNVLNSNGSVIPIFKEQIKAGKPVTLTDMRVTRYFITLEEVVTKLLDTIVTELPRKCIVIPRMNSYRIYDLAIYIYNRIKLNNDFPEKLEITGLKFGEKLHEQLIAEYEIPYIKEINKLFIIDFNNKANINYIIQFNISSERFNKYWELSNYLDKSSIDFR